MELMALLGKTVRVQVDRPVGYCHGDILYPINYGFIPGLMGGDGEEQDAYILGVSQPLEHFEGRVIAIIRRMNDTEDKLVVAPEGMEFHQAQIVEAVAFQERFFRTRIDSVLQKSCGVIPYREKNGRREYLILLQTNNCWSFPKGHMEPGETEEQTALRELREETGLSARLVPGARAVCRYPLSPQRQKEMVLFLGQVRGRVVTQWQEITKYRWVTGDDLKEYLHPDTCKACGELVEQ